MQLFLQNYDKTGKDSRNTNKKSIGLMFVGGIAVTPAIPEVTFPLEMPGIRYPRQSSG